MQINRAKHARVWNNAQKGHFPVENRKLQLKDDFFENSANV